MLGNLHRIPTDSVECVLYHGGCGDGFGGAYVFWTKLRNNPNVEYIPCGHHPDPKLLTQVTGKNVIMVDICFEKDFMEKLLKVSYKLLVLDHHKTTPERLPGELKDASVIDMDKSGCRLAWEYCYGNQEPPTFLKYIEDRDLWRGRYPETKAFTTAFYNSTPYEFEAYDTFREDSTIAEMIKKGEAILEYSQKQIDRLVKSAYRTTFLGYSVRVVESNIYQSELGSELSAQDGVDFAMIWHYLPVQNLIKVSLRSKENKVDVSEIAKRFGGGGRSRIRECASGFVWAGDSIQELLKQDQRMLGVRIKNLRAWGVGLLLGVGLFSLYRKTTRKSRK